MFFFFFQAEDGIRDVAVTGVQTCALPIFLELDINEGYRQRILSRLTEEPVVQAIAASQSVPLNGMLPTVPLIAGERNVAGASYNFVSPAFFQVLEIPILSGRNFTQEEAQARAPVAIVSQKTALRFWPEKQALGQILRITPNPDASPESNLRRFPVVRIVGVAADIVSCCFTVGIDPSIVYLPTTPTVAGTELLTRVHGSSDRARQTLDTELAAISPGDRKSTRLNSSHGYISYAVFCLKKKKNMTQPDNEAIKA